MHPRGGSMGKVREPQIALKTDQRTVLLEMDLGGKFQQKSSAWDENRTFLEGDVLEVEYAMAARVLTHVSAGPRPAPPPAQHIFRPRSDGVTGYVTSSHGAATPLRYGAAGVVEAGNRVLMNRPIASAASRVLVCDLWIALTGRSPRPSRSSRRSQDRLGTVTPSAKLRRHG
jgi:hypothetical protein